MNYLTKNSYKKAAMTLLALVVLFYTCKLMLKGAGLETSDRQVFLLLILIVFLSASKKAFWILVFPMSILYAIYSPIGAMFGRPTYQYVASVFATDVLESKEFFSQIPLINYSYPFFIIAGVVLYRYIIIKWDINLYRNKTLIVIMVIFSMLNQSPADFFRSILSSSMMVKNELIELNKLDLANEWGNSSLENSNYDTYILVIGESARRDYHHAYGYPVENTPFMSKANGFLVNGLTAGGTNTVSSLRLMLTKPNVETWEPNYSLNFVELAKSAGIKTFWVSNQGYFGEFDTPISAIARKSDNKFFIKSGNYDSENTSDFLLLKEIKKITSENKNNKKLIVVHLYGSHVNVCDRIIDYKKIVNVKDKKYSYLDCYVASIKKTDDFLEQLNLIMKNDFEKENKTYSMIYFSDHGQAHNEVKGVILFNNSRPSKYHYDIPLFKVSSDMDSRHECNSFKSGLNFIDGIGAWLGIKNKKLNVGYSLFDCTDDPSDFGLKNKINEIKGDADPAINIQDK